LILQFLFSLLRDWKISSFAAAKTVSADLDVNCDKILAHLLRAVTEALAPAKDPISSAAVRWVSRANNATKNAAGHASIRHHHAAMADHVKKHKKELTFACAGLDIEGTSVS
jgi:hypothetical protein